MRTGVFMSFSHLSGVDEESGSAGVRSRAALPPPVRQGLSAAGRRGSASRGLGSSPCAPCHIRNANACPPRGPRLRAEQQRKGAPDTVSGADAWFLEGPGRWVWASGPGRPAEGGRPRALCRESRGGRGEASVLLSLPLTCVAFRLQHMDLRVSVRESQWLFWTPGQVESLSVHTPPACGSLSRVAVRLTLDHKRKLNRHLPEGAA